MKKIVAISVIGLLLVLPPHAFCFIDYIFGGSAMNDAIGNNVVGDLRAWWTGNPVYNFNPYYSGGNQGLPAQNLNQGQTFQPMPQQSYIQPNQQPDISYYPPQGQQPYAYPQQQVMQQQAPIPQQRMQQMPQQSQRQAVPPPQARYQQPPQQMYQEPPQAYYQPQAQGYQQQGPAQAYYPQEQPAPGNRFQTYQYEQEIPTE